MDEQTAYDARAAVQAAADRYHAADADFRHWMGWRFWFRPITAQRRIDAALDEMVTAADEVRRITESLR